MKTLAIAIFLTWAGIHFSGMAIDSLRADLVVKQAQLQENRSY